MTDSQNGRLTDEQVQRFRTITANTLNEYVHASTMNQSTRLRAILDDCRETLEAHFKLDKDAIERREASMRLFESASFIVAKEAHLVSNATGEQAAQLTSAFDAIQKYTMGFSDFYGRTTFARSILAVPDLEPRAYGYLWAYLDAAELSLLNELDVASKQLTDKGISEIEF